jgi:two-component sensor histidine kinase
MSTAEVGTGEVLLALEPRADAARAARRALARAGLAEDVAHTVDLLVTELVANALRHGVTDPGQRIVLFGRVADDFARVEVADPGRGFDTRTTQKGLGLRMVDTLASRWGAQRTDKGFRVWVEVDRRSERGRRFARD